MRSHIVTAAIAYSILVAAAGAASSAESEFLDRFRGDWSGTGEVSKDANSSPFHANCRFTGRPTTNRIVVSGNCRVALIVKREITADLAFDPASGTYSGTYIGSILGPATLSGRRVGNTVNLKMTWPKQVGSPKTSSMTVVNDGDGKFRIVIGGAAETADLRLGKV